MISLIAAFDPNMCIGKGDDLPWHYPEDLKYFRAVTLNHRVLMGRKTFLSIIKRRGRPLSGRVNL
ncbi:MAG: dihydrofolate reductase, partial [Bacilli bacterium]|nr:dihydrofolate reductase [Bacilli bacterium]